MKTSQAVRTLGAVLRPVLLGIALAEAGLVATRAVLAQTLLDKISNGPIGDYLQTLGTVYAVLLAFVVFVVWSQFNDARGHVEREANELVDLYRGARGLPAGSRERVQRRVAEYVDGVLDREWSAMASGEECTFDAMSDIVDRLWDDLHADEPASECEKAVHAELLARFNDLSDVRTNRLTSAMLRIPLAMNFLLYTGAFVLVGSMYLFSIDSLWLHAILTGALAGALSHVLYLIHDLDTCFSGDWQVPLGAFIRVRRYIQAGIVSGRDAPGAADD